MTERREPVVGVTQSVMAHKIMEELKKCGITHVVWLPHSENKAMYETVLREPGMTLVPVCREGEAIPIALGLWLGGKNPVIMHQNTGFYDAGDSVRGLALDYQLPLLMLIGARGWRKSPPPTDSAAIFQEPVLDAWGIKHYMVATEKEVPVILQAYHEAQATSRPVAVLIAEEQMQ